MTSDNSFLKRLQQGVLIGDGAMGTMLYQRGVFLNSCFDELNLSRPDMVLEVHKAYVNVGVDFIETNTFGANGFKLARYALAENLEQINTAAARIARQAAGPDVLVAGSVGPLGVELTDFGPVTADQAADAFARQIRTLAEAGVDFLLLETFSSTDELLAAVKAASRCTDLPVVAQMSVNEDNETIYGEPVAAAMARLAGEPNVTAVGLNCSLGPSEMLSTLELIRSVTHKPISLQPNAGLPRHVEGRTLYMCTPEYMAEYAKRFFEKGARIIGGCCGTTPEHIGQIVKAVRPLHRAAVSSVRVLSMATAASAQAAQAVEPVPLPQKSRIGAKLAAGERITSIEITPPRGLDIGPVVEKARLCAEHGIDAINIPDGPRASSRMSPMVTAVRIQHSADIEAILHVCCRDRNLIGMQSDMLGTAAIGLKNILVITGDPPKMGEYPHATGVFDLDSVALTSVVANLNRGIDIGGRAFSPPTALTIAVGANPVAADLQREVERFKLKVRAGAEYAITQPVFDVDCFLRFLDAVEPDRIPIVAGIWPFTSYKNAEFMANEVPGVVVPPALLDRMAAARTRQQGRAAGVEIAREMIARIADSVAGFAVSAPFGDVRIALAVLGKMELSE